MFACNSFSEHRTYVRTVFVFVCALCDNIYSFYANILSIQRWSEIKRKIINHEMRIICISEPTNNNHLPILRHIYARNRKMSEKDWGILFRSMCVPLLVLCFGHEKYNDANDEKWDIIAFVPFAKCIFPVTICYKQ